MTDNRRILRQIDTDLIETGMIPDIGHSLSHWQRAQHFCNYLKESPMSPEENARKLEDSLAQTSAFGMIGRIRGRIAGIVWLHDFDPDRLALEASYRVNPDFNGCGVVTHLTRNSIIHALREGIGRVDIWHSAFNRGSFGVAKKIGGTIVDFVPDQTYLPNIGMQTDDFRWEVSQVGDGSQREIFQCIGHDPEEKIIKGLMKHDYMPVNSGHSQGAVSGKR